jgi:poly-gamma-glutamate synthesis protein (capsule biosynthesis protein)
MYFLGDIASPFKIYDYQQKFNLFYHDFVVCNLEGSIASVGSASLQDPIIFNDISVLDLLESLNVRVASLANNHIMDVQLSPNETIRKLSQRGILSCGAGDNIYEASSPLVCEHNSLQYVFIAFGWEVINCKIAKKNTPGVNPLDPCHVIKSVKNIRQKYPNAKIVLLMHWNYELELYPQPMHRQLAFAAIDEGANAIIGCHSHCLQGIEFYRGAPIVYGLGNWFFPHGYYLDGRLTFPRFSTDQIAFEWDATDYTGCCHLFRYDSLTHEVNFIEKKSWDQCTIIKALTPFRDMLHEEYISWFKDNRRKRMLLPVYENMNDRLSNSLKDKFVFLRHKFIRTLLSLKLKKPPN